MTTREDLSATSGAPGGRLESIFPTSSGLVGDLRHWPIFSHLEPEFAKTVRLLYVFEFGIKPRRYSLIVTHDDKVWAVLEDAYICHRECIQVDCWSPIEISELSGKGVRSFAHEARQVIALTGTGEVYLGIYNPTLVYNGDDPAEEIACGYSHSVCRTRTGAVYAWGMNHRGQIGSGTTAKQPVPRKVEGLIANLKCCGISCSRNSTVAVFENGDVYAWGFDVLGEFGTNSSKCFLLPVRVDFSDTFIKKVACGNYHALALADDGSLFVWGDNCYGQLGIEKEDTQSRPMRHSVMRTTYGRIVHIAVHRHISAVITENSEVLAWGKYADYNEGPWKDVKNNTIEVSGTSYPVYKAFIRHFYGGEVDVPTTEPLELLALDNSSGEHVLKAKCERLRRNSISVENCAGIYSAAVRCENPGPRRFLLQVRRGQPDSRRTNARFREFTRKHTEEIHRRCCKKGAFGNGALSVLRLVELSTDIDAVVGNCHGGAFSLPFPPCI